ncbi:uncharacterized protein A4U43_C09F7800 [Asparagus officinalis]|uniref:Uncharacterized protein n=1 Tax=Asparagus officinalis TaxID=4686 RepID=A0A5P1E694_ASPOF|nr:uncharacterized protein A4U43_C09F7800 [Asparagus officinalis]
MEEDSLAPSPDASIKTFDPIETTVTTGTTASTETIAALKPCSYCCDELVIWKLRRLALGTNYAGRASSSSTNKDSASYAPIRLVDEQSNIETYFL